MMVFFRIMELAGIVLVTLFVLLQIVAPALMGRPVFPMFRRKVTKAEQQLEHTHEEQLYQDVLTKIHDAQKQIEETQSRRK